MIANNKNVTIERCAQTVKKLAETKLVIRPIEYNAIMEAYVAICKLKDET